MIAQSPRQMPMNSTPPNPLIAATAEHLARFAPFDRMEPAQLAWMVERLTVGYYPRGEILLSPEQGVASRLFVIKQGVVQGEQNVARSVGADAWLELTEGECFPLGALLAERQVASVYRAKEDTFCYELSAGDFAGLVAASSPFRDFCTRRIANLLEQSKQIVQAQYSRSSAQQQSMSTPLSAIVRREPVTCPPDTPLRQVLRTLHEQGIGAMVAVENDRPIGIFTLHDVLDRVALAGFDLERPVIEVMTTRLTTLPPHAFAYEAALAMARHGIRHVLVVDSGRLTGIVSEKDLFTLQRVSLTQISTTVHGALTLDSLGQAALDIRQLAHNMLAQGVSAEQLTQIISTLNDLLTRRIIQLVLEALPAEERDLVADRFCWLAFGSEGRFEQTLNTDQDNGILFDAGEGGDPEVFRRILLPLAGRINRALDQCGFPLCKGEVMASNPRWCLSRQEWHEAFGGWIDHGDPEALLNATIFFDFRPLYGRADLAEDLRRWLAKAARDNARFLHQMAANALRHQPPLGLVRDFAVEQDHTLDLKLSGIAPFVEAARIFSLATGGTQTGTPARLRQAAEALALPHKEAEAWTEAFLFIQLLRLRSHHQQLEAGRPMSNRIDPDQLNGLDRRILKEAFRQARKLQSRLAANYKP